MDLSKNSEEINLARIGFLPIPLLKAGRKRLKEPKPDR